MQRYKGRLTNIVLIILMACLKPAFCQISIPIQHREWEVSGFVGSSVSGKLKFRTPVSGNNQETSRTVEMQHAAGYQVGVRANQNFNDFWSADLEYSFADQDLRLTNLSPSMPNFSLAQYIHHLSYDISYLPAGPRKRFRPYAIAGIGGGWFYIPGRAKKDALEVGLKLRDSFELVFNLGGGMKYLVADQFAVTFDVKHRWSGVPSYGLPESIRVVNGQYRPGMLATGVLQSTQFNFGLTFQWDE
jgi:opacity protein-like surface antigen